MHSKETVKVSWEWSDELRTATSVEFNRQLDEANAYIEKLKNTIVNLGFDGISILKEGE